MSNYLDRLPEVANADVVALLEKSKDYGDSWKKRGGVGAFMMLCRKWDRLEKQVGEKNYDIFKAIAEDSRSEGVLDDIRDLRRYLMLVEAEMVTPPIAGRRCPQCMVQLEVVNGVGFKGKGKLCGCPSCGSYCTEFGEPVPSAAIHVL